LREIYEVHIGEDGAPLNSHSELLLEGAVCVGYVRVLELRKLNGKQRVPRLSVRASAASLCSAVVLPLVEQTEELWQQATARWRERSDLFGSDSDDDDALVDELCAGRRWVADCTKAAPVLVPLLSRAAAQPRPANGRVRARYALGVLRSGFHIYRVQ
jgi:hypothetical protein